MTIHVEGDGKIMFDRPVYGGPFQKVDLTQGIWSIRSTHCPNPTSSTLVIVRPEGGMVASFYEIYEFTDGVPPQSVEGLTFSGHTTTEEERASVWPYLLHK